MSGSVLVIGDTQYLFDGDRTRPELLAATFAEVAELERTGCISPVRHVIHVGDVTEHGWPQECTEAVRTLGAGLQQLGGPALTVATGNHDVAHHSLDDRGPTPFLTAFGPGCPLLSGAGLVGEPAHSPDGYHSWRRVQLLDGEAVGVLALDWRPSPRGWEWAQGVLRDHRGTPTVVVCHDVANPAGLTGQGADLQDRLAGHPQVFLVLGGHEWPSARVSTPEREYHAVNYQQLPFGGAGAARVYDFDSGICRVVSICPSLRRPDVMRSTSARRLLALAGPQDQFDFDLPTALGGGGDAPRQAEGLRLVADLSPEGTSEFEAELGERFVVEVVCALPEEAPDRWQVMLARLGAAPGGSPEPLAALSLSTENFIGWQGFVEGGETWATSHEHTAGSTLRVVLANANQAGVWVDDDPVGRVDANLAMPLLAGPWRWRAGAGEYGGVFADEFAGRVLRVRMWSG